MRKLTMKQRDFLALGKDMKKVIELSENLTLEGDPFISEWMERVHNVIQKYKVHWMLKDIWFYQCVPTKICLFETLTDLRRILKNEGIFSEDLVK